MSSFFNVTGLGGNPFSTVVGQKIDQATDASLATENWALYMEICDSINESSENAKDAMKAFRKKLTQNAGKNYTVVMYTLTVLETCVKNCGRAFHLLVMNKEFIQELMRLIGPKNEPPPVVQEKVLNMIEIWAKTFSNQPDLNGVSQVYTELKNKGIQFPNVNEESAPPIFTPQRVATESSVGFNNPAIHSQTLPTTTDITQEQISKLQSELDIVTLNMSVLGDMLSKLKPGQEDPNDYKLFTDLVATCKEMQARIVDLIARATTDQLTAELLRLNDELNNLFLRHKRYEKNRDPSMSMSPSAVLGAAIGVQNPKKNTRDDNSLIDLSEEPATTQSLDSRFQELDIATNSTKNLSTISSIPAQYGSKVLKPDLNDEFAQLAQSRTSDQDIKPTSNTDGTKKGNADDSEFDEIEKWLDKSADAGPEESITSKEFENFLAERAAVADTLPSIVSENDGNKNKDKGKLN